MWELFIVLCTIHGKCEEIREPIIQDHRPSLFECQLYGQLRIIEHCERKLGYYPARWSCGRLTGST